VSVFLFGRKANLVLLTLFYSTLLALTHRQKDRRRNKYTRFAWATGTFFPVVLLKLIQKSLSLSDTNTEISFSFS
jgi:hypothetical protein